MAGMILKFAPYLIALLIGVFAGYRFELPRVQAAQLQLAKQQTADAQVVAAADAQAAQDAAQMMSIGNAAQAGLLARRQAGEGTMTAAQAGIAAQARQSGQDGPVAPVLADALAKIGGAP